MACFNKFGLLAIGVLVTLALVYKCDGVETKRNYDLDENHLEVKKSDRESVAKRAFNRLMSIKRSSGAGEANLDRANFIKNIQYNIDPYDSDSSDSDEYFSAEQQRYEEDQDSRGESSNSMENNDDIYGDDDDDDDSYEVKKKRGAKRKRGGYRLWKHNTAQSNLKKKKH